MVCFRKESRVAKHKPILRRFSASLLLSLLMPMHSCMERDLHVHAFKHLCVHTCSRGGSFSHELDLLAESIIIARSRRFLLEMSVP